MYMKNLFGKLLNGHKRQYAAGDGDEFCPRCDANLTLQKGYHNDLPYWNCKGCGEMLINPRVDTETDIAWICDRCESMLNEQSGFTEDCGEWNCTKCGFINKIDESEVYSSEDERMAAVSDSYYGMADEDVIALMSYEEIGSIDGREDIILIQNDEKHRYVKKILKIYDESIYRYLTHHPVNHMPRVISIHKGYNKLIVVEEYIDGVTIAEILEEGLLKREEAIRIAGDLCLILKELHSLEQPIIHRDIKPSNIMIKEDGEVILLDVNAAKWYNPEKVEDTRLLGTLHFAAPEQLGYGFSSSNAKADIYAVGILLNVMLTGKMPKEEKASGDIWNVIEHCICLNPDERYSDDELIAALNKEFGGNGEKYEREVNE